MRAYAVPRSFIGIIFGTDGHMADGTSPKATPRISIMAMAITQELIGKANTTCTKVKRQLPIISRVAPLPTLSYKAPKSGVKMMVPNGNIAGISPATSASTPYLNTINLVANFKNGNTPA